MRRLLWSVALWLVAVGALAGEGSSSNAQGRRWRGVFEPRQEAVIPSEMSMTVVSMPKEPGDSCREGDTLVVFDSTLPDAAVAAAQAKLASMELNWAGLQSLFDKNQATPVELSRAESDVALARLELETARRDAAACRVTAPFSGKIVERKVREHEWANKGAPLLLLVDDAVLRARFFLPEDQFSRIRLGDTVDVHVPAVSRQVRGVVGRLGVVFDPVSRTFDVWADVDNASGALRSGMTAEVVWDAAESSP